jgi:pSer/pThr/pTyr-binding forkhead associated (FHA) protein
MAEIVLHRADGTTLRASYRVGPALIGRSPTAPLRILDEFISRTHCEIGVREGQAVLRDLNSHNGTFVNDEQVQERTVVNGDRIRLGQTELTVEIAQPPRTPGSPAASGDFDVVLRVTPKQPPPASPGETVRITFPPIIPGKT